MRRSSCNLRPCMRSCTPTTLDHGSSRYRSACRTSGASVIPRAFRSRPFLFRGHIDRGGLQRHVPEVRQLVDQALERARDDPACRAWRIAGEALRRTEPAKAPRADQRKQLGERGRAGGRKPRDELGVEPIVEHVLRLRRLDEPGHHARQCGVLPLAQAPIARDFAIERGRRCRRIGLDVQRDELALVVDRVRSTASRNASSVRTACPAPACALRRRLPGFRRSSCAAGASNSGARSHPVRRKPLDSMLNVVPDFHPIHPQSANRRYRSDSSHSYLTTRFCSSHWNRRSTVSPGSACPIWIRTSDKPRGRPDAPGPHRSHMSSRQEAGNDVTASD